MELNITNTSNVINTSGQSTVEVQKPIKVAPTDKKDPSEKIEAKVNLQELNSSIAIANKVLFKNNSHLKFEIHDKTKNIMVKIINDESGEVLKEIPSEKILDMVAKLWEIAGILIDEKR